MKWSPTCAPSPDPREASGGGAIVDADNRRRFRRRGGRWLRTDGCARGPSGRRARPDRPRGRPRSRAGAPRCGAQDAYSTSADAVVDTDGREIDEVADKVLEAFSSTCREPYQYACTGRARRARLRRRDRFRLRRAVGLRKREAPRRSGHPDGVDQSCGDVVRGHLEATGSTTECSRWATVRMRKRSRRSKR